KVLVDKSIGYCQILLQSIKILLIAKQFYKFRER
ncbi:MAG: hypothetical protein FD167_3636, partial [bacterium]